MDPFKRPLPPPDELDPALFSITREERQYMADIGLGRASGVETEGPDPLPVSGSESSPPLAGPDQEEAA